jgi:hypothetical protein
MVDKVNNVVMFPGVTRNRPPQTLEEITKHVVLAKTTRIESVVENVIIQLFEDLFHHGYDFSDREDTNRDMAFLIEGLKSMLNRHDGMSHPFQHLAEQFFFADENGDLTLLTNDVAGEVSEGDTTEV